MTARFPATVVLGLALTALTALAAGCTVHTYSGAAYPGTTYARSEPTRYEISYRSDTRDHEHQRGIYRPSNHRPAKSTVRSRDTERFDTRGNERWTARDTQNDARATSTTRSDRKPTLTSKPAGPAAQGSSSQSEPVVLESAKPGTKTKTRNLRSFEERLGELVDQKKEQLAQEKRARAERESRMRRAINAAADEHD